ncbi:MAG: LuxR family transcriptional regulator [Novosphingobium sp.]|nr:LuxR family transcriptional regulator [Novosphingobium sp.]
MGFTRLAEELSSQFHDARDEAALGASLAHASRRMGFDHYALSCDYRPRRGSGNGLLVHDYPEEWAKVYVAFDLAGTDPVRRACERAVTGFTWGRIGQLIPMTHSDRQMLFVGRECGIGDGYTVPRHLPGEASGSCTFAVRPGSALPETMLFVAEIVGALALANALRISGPARRPGKPVLSDRQRECLLWSARGKTAGEIATILGISAETVIQHLKVARERYGVHCRQSLILCALFDGLIGFGDIFRTWDLQ